MNASDIRCFVLDVDGVLTDGRLYYGDGPQPLRAFHIHDGLAIRCFQKVRGPVVILTGKESTAVRTRAAELGIEHVLAGSTDKLADLTKLLASLEIPLSAAAMMGDDLPDLAAMMSVGYPIAPANAVEPVRDAARYVTSRAGGDGAVREAIERLLAPGGQWSRIVSEYQAGASRGVSVEENA